MKNEDEAKARIRARVAGLRTRIRYVIAAELGIPMAPGDVTPPRRSVEHYTETLEVVINALGLELGHALNLAREAFNLAPHLVVSTIRNVLEPAGIRVRAEQLQAPTLPKDQRN